jgi:hypothetical protein
MTHAAVHPSFRAVPPASGRGSFQCNAPRFSEECGGIFSVQRVYFAAAPLNLQQRASGEVIASGGMGSRFWRSHRSATGPTPWRHSPASRACAKSEALAQPRRCTALAEKASSELGTPFRFHGSRGPSASSRGTAAVSAPPRSARRRDTRRPPDPPRATTQCSNREHRSRSGQPKLDPGLGGQWVHQGQLLAHHHDPTASGDADGHRRVRQHVPHPPAGRDQPHLL